MKLRQQNNEQATAGVYVSLSQLAALKHRTETFSFLPRQAARSKLAGYHASRFRGRGLDFEELRSYRQGDDPRTIDWRVTQRTRKPHVRVYSEERSHAGMVIIDQSISMFYGTALQMKSVTSAETAAASAWQLLRKGDRPGGIVFNDSAMEIIRPASRHDNVIQLLAKTATMNQALHARLIPPSKAINLNHVLDQLLPLVTHDYTLVLVSDFHGADQHTLELVTRLAAHNDVICALIFDPSELNPADIAPLVVTDGALQVELTLDKTTTQQEISEVTKGHLDNILSWQNTHGVTVLPISSGEDPIKQLHALLGNDISKRRF